MANIECSSSNGSPTWGVIDLFWWKVVPEDLGGGTAFLQRFKDGWVRHNRFTILGVAKAAKLPPQLVAGTAWIEAGGDPTFIDRLAFEVRSFDWSGPDWVDEHLTITKEPSMTSFGAVSMQLRTAARTMGLDIQSMTDEDVRGLAGCLEKDSFNLRLVAKHLSDLARHDFPKADTENLTPEQIKVIGARYNRGIGLSLESIKKNTSYGDFILKIWPRLTALLK